MPLQVIFRVADIAQVSVLTQLVKEDALINSANTNLVTSHQTPPVTGIAKACWQAGGDSVLSQCDQLKETHPHKLELGGAVYTDSGKLAASAGIKYIIHAMAMAYRPVKAKPFLRKRRQLASPQSVATALLSALYLADVKLKLRSVAVQIMCSRPNYSTVLASEAPRVMLYSMLNAISSYRTQSTLRQVTIYIQDRPECAKLLVEAHRMIQPLGSNLSTMNNTSTQFSNAQIIRRRLGRQVMWVDIEHEQDHKQSILYQWKSACIQCELLKTSQQCIDKLSVCKDHPAVIITNWTRPHAKDDLDGLGLVKLLRTLNFQGVIICYGLSAVQEQSKFHQVLIAGANLVTADHDLLKGVVLHGLGLFEY
mmetsp:Transcript_20266/g.30108  ORF Transcript_20266/g.30108 Transcript_20266/m.30108 type:complete len:366 (+) Transcript_20266:3-1100(+)